jgi:DNA modification methylase
MELAMPSWPADKVERRALASLIPYARNARTHSDAQVAQIAASMKEWGFTNPVLIDEDGGIIAGHGRVLAARQLGLTEVPVMVAQGWTAAQKRAYVLADNQLALNAGWDDAVLGDELRGLAEWGFDTKLLGFDNIDALLGAQGTAALTDPDDVPPLPEAPISARGQLWNLGRHRVLCADSTSGENVARLLAGASIDVILTDPPYCSGGFQEANRASGSVGRRVEYKKISNDSLSTRGYQALLKTAFGEFGAPYLYAFTDWRMWTSLFDIAESSGFGVRSMIVWDKGTPGMGRGWRSQHELVLWACKQTAPWDKHAASAGNVIQCKRTGNVHHTTEKPVELIKQLLTNTPFAQAIADPFLGSGSTLIGCEMAGRQCFGAELDPAYVDVVIARWQAFTGQDATLDGDGRTFAQLSAERDAA